MMLEEKEKNKRKQKKKFVKRRFSHCCLFSGHFKDECININNIVKCNNFLTDYNNKS